MKRSDCYSAAEAALAEKRRIFEEKEALKRSEACAKIPELKKIDGELESTMAKFSSMIFLNATEKDLCDVEKKTLDLQAREAEILYENGFDADLMQPKYYCAKCKDTGYVDMERCECFKKEYSKILLKASNLAQTYSQQTFKTFRMDYYGAEGDIAYDRMQTQVVFLKKYAEAFPKNPLNLLFVGTPGSGKTFLSCAVAQKILGKGHIVFYTPVQDMITTFENARFGKGGESDTSIYTDCELLIIDDLGTEFQTQFSDSVLYNVINNRINLCKPMIISTNYTAEEMEGMYHDRLLSRLRHEFTTLVFPNVDVREEKKKRKVKKS